MSADCPDGTGDINIDEDVKFDLLYKDLVPEGALIEWGMRVVVYINAEGQPEVRWRRDGTSRPFSPYVAGILECVKQDHVNQNTDMSWDGDNDG